MLIQGIWHVFVTAFVKFHSPCHSKNTRSIGEFSVRHIHTRAHMYTDARAHTSLELLLCKVELTFTKKQASTRQNKRLSCVISFTWTFTHWQTWQLTYVYNFSSIKNTLTHTRAHTPTPSLAVIGEQNTTMTQFFTICICSWLIDSLTPAVAVPVWRLLRRCPGCVGPGSRRASVRSPPCSRQRSLMFRRRTVQPLALLSNRSTGSHQGYSSRFHRAAAEGCAERGGR